MVSYFVSSYLNLRLKRIRNKKVLLRDSKGHTARRESSTPPAVLSRDGGGNTFSLFVCPHPCGGTPSSVLTGRGGGEYPHLGQGNPPILTWLGYRTSFVLGISSKCLGGWVIIRKNFQSKFLSSQICCYLIWMGGWLFGLGYSQEKVFGLNLCQAKSGVFHRVGCITN